MVPMITKSLKKVCAAAVISGALLTFGTTAFAADGSNTGVLITSPAKEYQVKTQGKTVELTKPLRLQNIVQPNTDNNVTWQSVPDVIFHYDVVYNRFGDGADAKATALNADGTAFADNSYEAKYAPVATGIDSNGTAFDIWRGPAGGVTVTDVTFSHDDALDTADGDTVTKKITVQINGGEGSEEELFLRPGVYRYLIEEVSMKEVDFGEQDAVAANVTGRDADGNLLDPEVMPDITLAEEKELRFLDVYVEWDSFETGFVIKDVVLHDIEGALNASDHGDFAVSDGVAGGTEDTETGKKTGFSESVYTTYDLVIGKEIMGKGLTNTDINEREFAFEVKIEAPAGTKLRYACPAREGTEAANVATCDVADGTLTLELVMKQGQFALISGLPAGATYTVEELDTDDAYVTFTTYHTETLQDLILTATSYKGLLAPSAQAEKDKNRNVEMMNRQAAYELATGEGLPAADAAAKAGIARFEATDAHRVTPRLTIAAMEVMNPQAARELREAEVNHVFFLNLRPDNVVTGVAKSVAPFAAMVAVAAAGIGGFLAAKRKKEEEDED